MTDTTSDDLRRRRRRIIIWALLLLFLGLILAHLGWTRHERGRLMAVVQAYRAAGEPVFVQDFAPPQVDDPDNPAPKWRAAAAALQQSDRKLLERIDRAEFSVPLSDSEDELLRRYLDQNQAALQLAQAASRMHGRPDWRIQMKSPTITVLLPDLNQQRQLARTLAWSALDAHHHHDDALAAERLLEMLAQSRAVQHQPGLVGHLVAVGIESLACETACTIGPELQIGAATGPSAASASPQQIRQLIAELLDDRPLREGQILAYRSERMFELDTTLQVATGQLDLTSLGMNSRADSSPALQTLISYVMGPIIYDDGRVMIEHTTRVLKAAQSPDWFAAQTALDSLPDVAGKRGPGHLLLSKMMPAFGRAVLQDFRILTDKRLTAVMLACRWYAADHGGELPKASNDLVPAYLPAIPPDPYTSGSALRYRAGPNPVVYSAGENLKDDGGSEQPINSNHPDDRWEQLDVVTHLRLQARAAPPPQPDEEAEAPAATRSATAPATQSDITR